MRAFIDAKARAVVLPKGVTVTLVAPRYPVNLGHVARLVRNFGVERLYLVNPRVDMSVAAVYASHASDVLDDAEEISFQDLRERTELLVATTAVRARRRSNFIRRSLTPERVRDVLASAKSSSLVFGRDSTGLTNQEINFCDATVTIDVGTEYKSLNLGHAVAIMLYAASRGVRTKGRVQSRTAREVFAKGFRDLAVASSIHPHKVKNIYEVGKRIASASQLTDAQLNLMSGAFNKAVDAIGGSHSGDSKT